MLTQITRFREHAVGCVVLFGVSYQGYILSNFNSDDSFVEMDIKRGT